MEPTNTYLGGNNQSESIQEQIDHDIGRALYLLSKIFLDIEQSQSQS